MDHAIFIHWVQPDTGISKQLFPERQTEYSIDHIEKDCLNNVKRLN